ncbi:MAG: ATP-binding protein [Gemmatimonadales bacterium]
MLSWSTGKDAAWTLHELRLDPSVEVVGLLTSVVPAFGRVSMHGVRVELARAQAAAAGVPLVESALPWPCSNEIYERVTREALARVACDWGVTHVAFGDLFLADVRAYRERLLGSAGLEPMFPLWGRDTRRLAAQMVGAGVRAHIACLDPARLDRALAGAVIDAGFLAALPPEVDPCGERGEFHTFVSDGPMFLHPVAVEPGVVTERDGFVYADLLPGTPVMAGG